MQLTLAKGKFYLDSLMVYDYYPYGMLHFGKLSNSFIGLPVIEPVKMNGIEKDEDIKGNDFGSSVYDSITGKFYKGVI